MAESCFVSCEFAIELREALYDQHPTAGHEEHYRDTVDLFMENLIRGCEGETKDGICPAANNLVLEDDRRKNSGR